MKRRYLSTMLGAGIVVAVTLTATTAGWAQHGRGHYPPGHWKKHERWHEARRGGPPPWAPAWGYRRKETFRYWRHGIEYETEPTSLVLVPEAGPGRCNRDIVGAVVGGAVGAVAGSQIGKGDGRTLATIGGAIIGALVGGNVGRAMDEVDQNCVGQVLERTPTGRTVTWNNPDQNSEYRVTPTRTYQTGSGQYCREYQTKIIIDGQVENAYGTACRQPDGSWKKV